MNKTDMPIFIPRDIRVRQPMAIPMQTPIMLPMKSTNRRAPRSSPRLISSTLVTYRHRIRMNHKEHTHIYEDQCKLVGRRDTASCAKCGQVRLTVKA